MRKRYTAARAVDLLHKLVKAETGGRHPKAGFTADQIRDLRSRWDLINDHRIGKFVATRKEA
jgi:hypothetical protein